MKQFNFTLIFIVFLLLFSNCKERENDSISLPEATQSGAKTGGAIVNGRIWVASNKKVNTLGGNGTYCEMYNKTAIINIDLRNVADNSRIFLKTAIQDFQLNKTYFLSQNPDTKDYDYATYSDNDKGFSTQPNSKYIGEINISRLDIQNQIVSGTFNFIGLDLYGNNGEIEVKDGRFDRKFD